MDERRVAELHNQKQKSGGTGYLITEDLILTAHHIIAPINENGVLQTDYDIRFIGDYEQGKVKWIEKGCYLCWDSKELDLALLKLVKGKPAFLSSQDSPATRFGKLPLETLIAKGTGFPVVQKIENRNNPEPLRGNLSRLAAMKEGQLRLQVTSPIPKQADEWKGISGTALFVDNFLVGVIVETNKSFAEQALWATPISVIAEDPNFCELVLGDRNLSLPLESIDDINKVNSIIVNPIIDETLPPPIGSWQNRSQENKILQWLSDKQVRLVGVVAAGGYGKSSLVAHLFEQVKGLQDKLWANFQEPYSFNTFGLWLLRKIARDEIYQSNTDEELATELVNRLAKGQYLLVMDNLETLVGTSLWQPYQSFFQKWLAKGRNSTILITSRERIELQFEHRCHWLELPGLPIESGITLLESLGIRGEETQLKRFVETAEGHPLLLTLTAQWIKSLEADGKKIEIHTLNENQVTLFEKIVGSHRGDPQASVGKVLSESFRHLSQPMQALLMNLSVYRRPFSTKMAKVMASHDIKESMIKSEFVQRSLLIQQKSDGKSLFKFQPLIQRYIKLLLEQEGDIIEAHERAIEYYDNESKRRKHLKEEEALELFEILYHGCKAGQAEHAARMLNKNFDWLKSRGYFDVVREYYEIIMEDLESQPISDPLLLAGCCSNLSAAYLVQGKYQQALDAAEKALELSQEGDYDLGKASTLDRISAIHTMQGKPRLAIGFSKQALEIARQSSDLHFLSNVLGNLALAYDHSKQYRLAIEAYEEALKICRQTKDIEGESRLLKSLGNIYYRPDNPQKDFTKAVHQYEQALSIAEKFSLRHIKATALCDLGIIYFKQRDFLKALNNLQAARDVFEQIGDRRNEAICLRFLGAAKAVHNWKTGNWNWSIESIEGLLAAKKIELELGVPIDVWNPNIDKIFKGFYSLLDSEPIRRLLNRSK
ncbi:tetratricopeptide repeat protein [Phormidesmis sp. 146-35]